MLIRKTKVLMLLIGDETSLMMKEQMEKRNEKLSTNEMFSLFKHISDSSGRKRKTMKQQWEGASHQIASYLCQCYASRPFTEPFPSLSLSQRLQRLMSRRSQFLFPSNKQFNSQPFAHMRYALWSCSLPHDPHVHSSLSLISSRLNTLGSSCLSSHSCSFDLPFSSFVSSFFLSLSFSSLLFPLILIDLRLIAESRRTSLSG